MLMAAIGRMQNVFGLVAGYSYWLSSALILAPHNARRDRHCNLEIGLFMSNTFEFGLALLAISVRPGVQRRWHSLSADGLTAKGN